MEKDTEITEVIFRKWKNGEILALMPYEPELKLGNVGSYMQIGQHGTADYGSCIARTKPATPDEYADLKREMEGLGYNIVVVQKQNNARYMAAWHKMQVDVKSYNYGTI